MPDAAFTDSVGNTIKVTPYEVRINGEALRDPCAYLSDNGLSLYVGEYTIFFDDSNLCEDFADKVRKVKEKQTFGQNDWIEVSKGVARAGFWGEEDAWYRADADLVLFDPERDFVVFPGQGTWFLELEEGEREALAKIFKPYKVPERVTPKAEAYYAAKKDQGKAKPSSLVDSGDLEALLPWAKLTRTQPDAVLQMIMRDHGGPGAVIKRVSDVLRFGAEKYAWDSWRDVPDAETRYRDAALRHLLWQVYYPLDKDGLDEESGLPHWAHCACCLMFLTQL